MQNSPSKETENTADDKTPAKKTGESSPNTVDNSSDTASSGESDTDKTPATKSSSSDPVSNPPVAKLFSTISVKRSAANSPEETTALKKKEKKKLKENPTNVRSSSRQGKTSKN